MKYTLPKDTEINATIIKEAIDYNEERRERFDTLDRYYIGDQDILHREKPDLLHNNKVMIMPSCGIGSCPAAFSVAIFSDSW